MSASWSRVLVAALLCSAGASLTGCATAFLGPKYRSYADTELGQFEFEYHARDRESRERIEKALVAAGPRLAEWGGLREPVKIIVLPSHEALEAAVNQHGYSWLLAWARYDEVFMQSPRTWSWRGAKQADIDEFILHELTHTVMYQQSADRTHWRRKGIPMWFSEGMASYTARQAYRWPAPENLAEFYEKNPGSDPLTRPEPLYRDDSRYVYGAAHHAFSFLMRRYGAQRVRDLLAQMRQGAVFKEAFLASFGLTHEGFVDDFRRYIQLRGFRGTRHRARPVPPAPTPAPRPTPMPEEAPASAPDEAVPRSDPAETPVPGADTSAPPSGDAPGSSGPELRSSPLLGGLRGL